MAKTPCRPARTAQLLTPHAKQAHWLYATSPALGVDQLQQASAAFLEAVQRQIAD